MPEHYVRRVLMALEALSQNPAPTPEYDVKKLAGMRDAYRIRIGAIRIEYDVNWESGVVRLLFSLVCGCCKRD
jgi:mRNA-degrading endonuclease RelE of RelBE toxin-antitoxin system